MAVFFDQDMTGATIAINDGVNNETWSYDTEIGDTGTDLYTAAESFVAWANDAARGWSGTLTFSYTFTLFGVNHGITLNGSGVAFAYTTNDAASSTMGLPLGTTATGSTGGPLTGDTGVRTTLSAKYAFDQWTPYKGEGGSISRGGSFNYDPFPTRLRTARIRAVFRQSDAYAMSIALSQATTPRRAVFYDYTDEVYRRVFVPDLTLSTGRRLLHKFDFQVIEAA